MKSASISPAERAEAQIARLQNHFSEIQRSSKLPFPKPAPAQIAQLQNYIRLLLAWNQRINLISPNDEDRVAERHILESLAAGAVWDFPQESRVLDLGSGGGFPGIPLKIMRPDLAITLLESRQKKALFLNTVVRELQLENCLVVNARAEELIRAAGEKFSIVIARAVADLKTLWEWSKPLLVDNGVLLAMKGGELESELKGLRQFDSRTACQVLKYLAEWKIDESRYLVMVSCKLI